MGHDLKHIIEENSHVDPNVGKVIEVRCVVIVRERKLGTLPMLWGAHAQSKRVLIPSDRGHLVLMSNHPSPLSALRPPVPFIGNGHFGQAKAFREQHGY